MRMQSSSTAARSGLTTAKTGKAKGAMYDSHLAVSCDGGAVAIGARVGSEQIIAFARTPGHAVNEVRVGIRGACERCDLPVACHNVHVGSAQQSGAP